MQLLPLLAWALLPGCWAVTGPDKVQGFLGGSLSVTCRYEPDWEMQPKFWCVPGTLYTCGKEIVITSRQQPEVRRGRFSIRDNRESREITVIVEDLTKWDNGTHLCGVRTGKFWVDRSHRVEVIVSPVRNSLGPFRYFPVLAGLQVLALLAMIGAVLRVTLRAKETPTGPHGSPGTPSPDGAAKAGPAAPGPPRALPLQ